MVDGEKDIERHYSIDGLRQLFLYTDAVCQVRSLSSSRMKVKLTRTDARLVEVQALQAQDDQPDHQVSRDALR